MGGVHGRWQLGWNSQKFSYPDQMDSIAQSLEAYIVPVDMEFASMDQLLWNDVATDMANMA
jgi:hypothetical protein